MKMVNEILHGLYSLQYMAAHSLAGGGGKPSLDGSVVAKIVG